MPTSARIFIAILVVFTLLVLYFIFQPGNPPRPENELASINVIQGKDAGKQTEGAINALVIDTDGSASVTLSEVLEGDDVILLYIPQQPEDTERPKEVFVFNDLMSLSRFDKNDSGYIDAMDPIYHLLYVGVLDADEKTLRYVKLEKIGVAVIVLNKKYFELEKAKSTARYKQLAGTVITADNSHWRLKVLPMPISDFSSLQLIERE